MFSKTKIALSVALILGTASVALAGSDKEEPNGGYVVSGSMDGVNPVYHPELFGNVYGSVAPKQANRAARQQAPNQQAHKRQGPAGAYQSFGSTRGSGPVREPTYMYIQSQGYRDSIGE